MDRRRSGYEHYHAFLVSSLCCIERERVVASPQDSIDKSLKVFGRQLVLAARSTRQGVSTSSLFQNRAFLLRASNGDHLAGNVQATASLTRLQEVNIGIKRPVVGETLDDRTDAYDP